MEKYATWGALGLLGVASMLLALNFGFGRGPQIGAAAMPLLLSGGLIFISVWGLISGGDEPEDKPDLRPFIAVVGAVVAFILGVERIGLVPTTVLCMGIAYLGQSERRYAGFLTYATLFGICVWAVFILGLGLPVPPFGGN